MKKKITKYTLLKIKKKKIVILLMHHNSQTDLTYFFINIKITLHYIMLYNIRFKISIIPKTIKKIINIWKFKIKY